jgi:transposase InsO family protein
MLCITDAFAKYAVVTAIADKKAETVADAIYKEWFSKFGIPAQIHTDDGKEYVNKLLAELFQLLNASHTKTSPAHPQYNAQVEVFNKAFKKPAIICEQHNFELGNISSSTGSHLQHWLSLHDHFHSF